MKPADIVDLADIANMLGVKRSTPAQWQQRGLLPAPAGHVSGCPYWERYVIAAWAAETGRMERRTTSDSQRAPKTPQIAAQPEETAFTEASLHEHVWVAPKQPGAQPYHCSKCPAQFLGWNADGTAKVAHR